MVVQKLWHVEPLTCSVDAIWKACKNVDEVLPRVMPDYFQKSEYLEGNGGPGTLRLITMGPGKRFLRKMTSAASSSSVSSSFLLLQSELQNSRSSQVLCKDCRDHLLSAVAASRGFPGIEATVVMLKVCVSMCVCAAVGHAKQVKERMDVIDEENKTLKYTMVDGDPRYSSFGGMMKFTSGAEQGTSDAYWEVQYEPVGDMGPPEHVKAMVIKVFRALEGAINADPQSFA